MLIFIVFGLLLPLTLAVLLVGLACFFVGRPRLGMFFIFQALDNFRRFAYYLLQITDVSSQDSWTYSFLSSDLGSGVTWAGSLFFLVWSVIDQYQTMGGLKGLKIAIQESKDYYNKKQQERRMNL